jgi:uncharacterized protein YbjQ (UPF0145 family)
MSKPDEFDAFVDDLLVNGEKNAEVEAATVSIEEDPHRPPAWLRVVVCTTPSIPERQIKKTLGVVSGRAVKGQGPLKNLLMKVFADEFGRRSATLEKEFQQMEQECFRQLKVAANDKGANAVVSVALQFGETSGEADLFFAVATGTAVVVE